MKAEEASNPQDELARLRRENARLRAMIDQLERRGGDEPAPLAPNTQIMKAEAEPLPGKTRKTSERPKKPRKQRKRKQKRSLLHDLFLFLLALPVLASIIYLSAWLFEAIGFNFSWLSELQTLDFLFGIVSIFVLIIAVPISEKVQEEIRWYRRVFKNRQKKQSRPLRRRITRKLRPAITQKLSEDDC